MAEHTGWLLDVYEDDQSGVVVWFLDDDGTRRRLRQAFPVTFYAAGPNAELAALWRFLSQMEEPPRLSRQERLDVSSGQCIPVLAAEVDSPAALPRLFQRAEQAFPNLTYADADLQISLRYAAATGAGTLARCQITVNSLHEILGVTPLDSPWDLEPSDLPLRILTLEPDTNPSHAAPRTLQVQAGNKSYCLPLQPVRPLLVNLQSILSRFDPDLILTSWGDTWLLPWLLEQGEKSGIPLALNRDPRPVAHRKERTYFSYGRVVYKGEQILLYGRWHIDRHNAMLWDDYTLDGIFESSRVTSLPVQTTARTSPGTGISAIQMLTALRHGVLVPYQKQQAELFKSAADLFSADQGGLVYQPTIGLHENVAEIDFVSMYPAIMVYFNISPETLGVARPGAQQVPELGLFIDNSRQGIVPQSLAPLVEKRVAIKQVMNQLPNWDPRRPRFKSRASALKWLLVTCFGYLGYKNARFGRIEAHQAVTAYGREMLMRAKEIAEDMGFEVLHMFVDALWVRKAGMNRPEDFQELLDHIKAETTIPIALDGIYRWVTFLPSKTRQQRPVANRYFGVFQDGSIKVRGIDARRHDTPPFISGTQMEMVELLAKAPSATEGLAPALALLRCRLDDLRRGRVPLEDLVISQRLSRKLEEYRSLSAVGRAVAQLREAGKDLRPGQNVRYLLTLGHPGVRAWDLPGEVDPRTANLPRYRTLLLRAASSILQPLGGSLESLEIWERGGGRQPRLPVGRILTQTASLRTVVINR